LNDQAFAYAVRIGDIFKRFAFARFRELAITCMQRSEAIGAVAFTRYSSGDAGIHSPAQ